MLLLIFRRIVGNCMQARSTISDAAALAFTVRCCSCCLSVSRSICHCRRLDRKDVNNIRVACDYDDGKRHNSLPIYDEPYLAYIEEYRLCIYFSNDECTFDYPLFESLCTPRAK